MSQDGIQKKKVLTETALAIDALYVMLIATWSLLFAVIHFRGFIQGLCSFSMKLKVWEFDHEQEGLR